MQDYVEIYETINNQVAISHNKQLERYWNQTKESIFNDLTDYSYDGYCYDVVNKIIDDEMRGEIRGNNLLAIIKMGLPYYAAI